MKIITTEQHLIISEDVGCHSYAKERIVLRRHDDPGQKSFISVEHVNLEPNDDYPTGAITFGSREQVKQVFDAIDDFIVDVQRYQDQNGDIK